MTEAQVPRRVGEVVESASDRFVAQCYTLYESPSLGAFVRAGSEGANGDGTPVYGVVYGVSTQSLDPGRPVIARGGDSASEDEVYDANPQLARLLCTRSLDFLGLLLGASPFGPGMADEVIAACLRRASAHQEDPRGFLVGAGKALAAYLSRDLTRLDAILRRLRP